MGFLDEEVPIRADVLYAIGFAGIGNALIHLWWLAGAISLSAAFFFGMHFLWRRLKEVPR